MLYQLVSVSTSPKGMPCLVHISQSTPPAGLLNGKACLQRLFVLAALTNYNLIIILLHNPLLSDLVPEACSILDRNRDLDILTLSFTQRNFGKSFELLVRSADAGVLLGDVDLYDFRAGNGAGVGNLDANLQLRICLGDFQVGV